MTFFFVQLILNDEIMANECKINLKIKGIILSVCHIVFFF